MKIEAAIKQPKFRNDIQKAILNLAYTASWLTTQQEIFFKPFGITSSQFNILRILRGQNGRVMTGQEIKARMLERNSDISRLLDRLEMKRFINRTQCTSDGRATSIGITSSGLDVLKAIDSRIDQAEKKLIKLTGKEARLLSDLLDKARGNS